jgi:lipid-binding SYLF domain-containing protein
MKKLFRVSSVLLAAVVLTASPLVAGPFKKDAAKLDEKIVKIRKRFMAFQQLPQKQIPARVLAGAKGIIMIHKVKAGLGIGAEAGGGVALVKDPRTGLWSPPAFVASAEGSWGLQVGAQESDIYLILMNEEGLKILRDKSVNIGVDVQASAGPASAGGDIDTTTIREPVLVYSNSGGLFAGAAFKGGGILPAKKNNAVYYGLTLEEILFGRRAVASPTAEGLIESLRAQSGERPSGERY